MSLSIHATLHRVFGDELSGLLYTVLAGEVVADRDGAERLARALGALVYLHGRHRLDARGWCRVCWPVPRRWWRPWPRRPTCTVHAALSYFLRQPSDLVLTPLTEPDSALPGAVREFP